MPHPFNQSDLEAYLDEALPPEEMARIEEALRRDERLVRELAAINTRRDSGAHSLGEIWRRRRLTCIAREQLGAYLLDVLAEPVAKYIKFHLEVLGCRFCQANLADLKNQQRETTDKVSSRRRKFFQSSAGLLNR